MSDTQRARTIGRLLAYLVREAPASAAWVVGRNGWEIASVGERPEDLGALARGAGAREALEAHGHWTHLAAHDACVHVRLIERIAILSVVFARDADVARVERLAGDIAAAIADRARPMP